MINLHIVEDKIEIRESLENNLNQAIDIVCNKTYSNAEDALIGICMHKPDIVLMDIGLPQMNGIECMLRIKQKHPNIKFLMFTVFDTDDYVFDALKAGADGFILKREPILKIIQSIREIIDGGAPMSKSIASKVLRSFRTIPVNSKSEQVEKLTKRQNEILEHLSKGKPYKMIADEFGISIGTVKQHIHQIYKKLEVNNKIEAINKYLGRQE